MRYFTVTNVLEFKTIYQLRCMVTGDIFYVRSKYFAGYYKKMDVIKL